MHAAGASPCAIAARLRTSEATIRRDLELLGHTPHVAPRRESSFYLPPYVPLRDDDGCVVYRGSVLEDDVAPPRSLRGGRSPGVVCCAI